MSASVADISQHLVARASGMSPFLGLCPGWERRRQTSGYTVPSSTNQRNSLQGMTQMGLNGTKFRVLWLLIILRC